jgi:hypothetical protein
MFHPTVQQIDADPCTLRQQPEARWRAHAPRLSQEIRPFSGRRGVGRRWDGQTLGWRSTCVSTSVGLRPFFRTRQPACRASPGLGQRPRYRRTDSSSARPGCDAAQPLPCCCPARRWRRAGSTQAHSGSSRRLLAQRARTAASRTLASEVERCRAGAVKARHVRSDRHHYVSGMCRQRLMKTID